MLPLARSPCLITTCTCNNVASACACEKDGLGIGSVLPGALPQSLNDIKLITKF